MITSNMNYTQRYALNDDLKAAFDFLKNTDLDAFPAGKSTVNERIQVIKSTYNTRALGDTFWESHENFIDIQYIHKGCEKIAYAPIDALKASLYFEPNDLKILKGRPETFIHLNEGEYAILFPEDGHMPTLDPFDTPVEVTKFVIKVPV